MGVYILISKLRNSLSYNIQIVWVFERVRNEQDFDPNFLESIRELIATIRWIDVY